MPRIFHTLVRCFLVGVIAVLPLVITVGVVIWVSNFFARLIGPGTILGESLRSLGLNVRITENKALAYVVGWLIVLIVIFGLGALVQTSARRLLFDKIDALAKRIPILGGVYGTVRQLTGMLDTKDRAELKGMRVVFCVFASFQLPMAAALAMASTAPRAV